MATLEQLSAALIKADAAGNTADAKTFADAIRQMKAAPATPVLSDSLQPSVAQVSPNEIPGARKELTKGQQVYQGVRNFAAPTIEAAGAIGGGIIGGGAGTLVAPGVGTATGAVAGAGLGYGIAKEYLENFDVLMGMKAPRTGAAQVTEPVRNILEGSTFEAGGRVLGQGLGYLLGKVADIRNIPKNKAAEIARNALGPDLPEVLNALKTSQGQNVSAAQATSNINSPTWQALLERVSKRDPRFLAALEESQGEVSLNALAKLAGGATAAEARGTVESAKNALNAMTTPQREAALNRANLGKSVADFEAQAGKLSTEAAAEVQKVRDLISAGNAAEAWARLDLIKRNLPVGATKYTQFGGLADKAFGEWSSKAAQASLDLGQGAKVSQGAADALRSVGIKPLESEPLVRSIKAVTQNPELAGNDVMKASVNNLARDIAEWTSSGGVIDARALDAIRKNSVNAAVRDLLKGQDPSVQREAAASVMVKLKPLLVDAIEAAGGTGYRQYLADYTKGMQQIAEKKLTGEALKLWKTNKDEFVRLVTNESPDVVEKFLGKGNYNIATELADSTLSTLRTEADKVIRNAKIDTQVTGGQDALKKLLLDNLSILRLPSYITAVASTTNKALGILENKIGDKTMTLLANASKTPGSAASLLETLPAVERNRVIALISDPSKWSKGAAVDTIIGSNAARTAKEAAEAIRIGSVTAGVNALAPDRYNKNALTKQPVRIIPRLEASGMTTANPTGQFTQ
jgi:hypothetical protein